MFPSNIRDRLIGQEPSGTTKKTGNRNLGAFLADSNKAGEGRSTERPIADLYLNATVLFADIVGL